MLARLQRSHCLSFSISCLYHVFAQDFSLIFHFVFKSLCFFTALSSAPCLLALNLSNSATAAKNVPRETGALALASALRAEQCSLRELKLDGIGAVAAAIVLAFGMRLPINFFACFYHMS